MIRPGEALLVPPGDLDALTAALGELATDPVRRLALGAAGRAAAVERFTWRAVIDRVLDAVDGRMEIDRAVEPIAEGVAV